MDWSVQLLQQEADATAALVAADITPVAGDDGVGDWRGVSTSGCSKSAKRGSAQQAAERQLNVEGVVLPEDLDPDVEEEFW